jgi:hypothetical protein
MSLKNKIKTTTIANHEDVWQWGVFQSESSNDLTTDITKLFSIN